MTGRGATHESILSLFAARGDEFSARNLATAAHRVAKFGGRNRDRRIREFNPRDLANTAWAFAKAGIEAPHLFAAIADAAHSRLGEFKPPELANTSWAFAKAGIEAPQLFDTIALAARSWLGQFNPQQLAITAWAFATAGIEAPQLFDAIALEARSWLGEFNPQDLANSAWAFATTGIKAPQLFDAIAVAALSRLGEFNPQELANTAWVFACADWKKDPEFFAELACIVATDLDALDDRHLSRLHLASLHFHLEWPDRSFPLSNHHQMLVAAFQRQDPSPPLLQRDVATALDRVGWAHIFERVTEEGLSLDMAQPDTKRAVEVDGPYHYLERTRVETGSTRFKSRLLRRLGWNVVHVPLFDWGTLDGEREQDSYLRAKLFATANA
ncbi:hypothetical protein CTAYLR_010370 [Chrysophaeum taylorii]|uniref:RAP domain-containing protein n=1 Tax=Chrysophaeum taylorii TaxID=2483200 RepID=A0AAD7UJT2_9STRA|nr:hypothetical protein CTAYLR_010370 [Chrysophaeum taylorii]